MAEKTKEEIEAEKKKGEEDQKKEVDPQIAEIMKSPDAVLGLLDAKRKANDEAKQYRLKLEKIEKDQEDANKKTLEKQGEWQKVAEKEKADREALNAKFKEQVITSALKVEAMRIGIIDPGDIALVDRKDIKVSDDFSQVDGAKEAVEIMKKSKPYLFGEAKKGGADGRDDKRPPLHGGVSDEKLTPEQRINRGVTGTK